MLMQNEIRRPSIWLHLSEIWRAAREYRRAKPFLSQEPKEDEVTGGYPILVIPGFMASDTSTAPLRSLLNRLGYSASDWGLGRNYANLKELDKLSHQIGQIYQDADDKLTIVGWSLGGVYARRLATLHEDKIRRVITLGSPYKHLKAPNYGNWLYQIFQKMRGPKGIEPAWVETLSEPISVPSVAFYSKTDGIVPWQACMDDQDPTDHKNIEVTGSHIGLGVNEEVLSQLLEILRQDRLLGD